MHNESLQHIALACANRTSRTARLTCGQRYIWKVIRALSGIETLNVPVTFDVENPQDVATISDKIAWFVERRAALRTTFPIGDDGNPQQVLHTEGHIPLTIVESDTDGLPATLARLVSTFEALPFDMASDLPLRCGILTSNGEPKSVVLCFSHMVVDGWSANLVQEEFFKVLNDGAGSANWPDDWSPFDQAEWERSPEGGEVLEESLDHWRRAIAQFPRAVFHHAVAQETTQRWRGAEINSAAMGIAARFLADQHKVSTATVLLVSLSLILSRIVATRRFCATVLYCNRTTTETEGAVGSFPQGTPVIVDLTRPDFAAMLDETHFGLMDAYMNGMAWPPSVDAELKAAGAARGVRMDVDTSFNISHDATLSLSESPEIGDIKRLLAAETGNTTIAWEEPRAFDLHTFSIKSYAPSCVFILADTNYINAADIDRILLGLEKLIIALAVDPNEDIWAHVDSFGIGAFNPTPDFHLVGGSWINLETVRCYVERIKGVSHAAIFADPNGRDLRAYYVADADIAADLMERDAADLLMDRSTMIPAEFVRCAFAPSTDQRDEKAWLTIPVMQRTMRGSVVV